jgi:8-oxo-dGTP diphosphatase
MKKIIVALIIEKDGKFLVEKRDKLNDDSPDKIVFPAGTVEEGESNEQTLRREMQEELNIIISNPKLIHREDHHGLDIHWYTSDWTGEITNNENQELLWTNNPEVLSFQSSKNALSKFLNR